MQADGGRCGCGPGDRAARAGSPPSGAGGVEWTGFSGSAALPILYVLSSGPMQTLLIRRNTIYSTSGAVVTQSFGLEPGAFSWSKLYRPLIRLAESELGAPLRYLQFPSTQYNWAMTQTSKLREIVKAFVASTISVSLIALALQIDVLASVNEIVIYLAIAFLVAYHVPRLIAKWRTHRARLNSDFDAQ